MLPGWVLGEWFGAKNVSSVPSILSNSRCQMVQVRDAKPTRTAARTAGNNESFYQQVLPKGTETKPMTKTDDKGRKWMWWFLAAVVAAQLYFVQELLAAFALFAAGFAVVAVLVSSIYMMQKVWEVGAARIAERRTPAGSMARRAAAAMEELGSRPFRRPV
jgi:uncharacterized membrane protein YciS (DUF1049 family)